MKPERLIYLHQIFLKGLLSKEEAEELSLALADDRNELIFKMLMDGTWYKIIDKELQDISPEKTEKIFQNITTLRAQPVKLWTYSLLFKVAATLIVISLSIVFYRQYNAHTLADSTSKNAVILPGKKGGILTLANGKKILLSKFKKEELATESGLKIIKTKDGKLIYEVDNPKIAGQEKFNTLSTAMGETYELHLPDGTLVWLNSGSSLTYSVFLKSQKQRKVTLDGEAYFEVAKDKSRPFIVESARQKLVVLGTHFNIRSYKDEPNLITTLLEGSVKLNDHVKLMPGEQGVNDGRNIKVSIADIEHQIAWKNGDFIFRNDDLESIMREVGRWYNVQILYRSEDLKRIRLEGIISRSRSIYAVLEMLESTGSLKFNINQRKIEIYK